jgi:hypothetical protein
VSSPVDVSKDYYLVAMYLETSVVWLNNNTLLFMQVEDYIYCKL